jgi:hypothetical protein
VNTFWYDLGIGVLASLIWTLLLIGLAYVIARRWIVSWRSRLIDLLRLDAKEPAVTIYLARHDFATALPRIEIPASAPGTTLPVPLRRLTAVQGQEDTLLQAKPMGFTPKPFKAVAAVEMIELLRLQRFLSRPAWIERLPQELQSQLRHIEPRANRIKVEFDTCPERVEDFASGPLILIGGPRSNHATFYFCYGKEACRVRLGRMDEDKHKAFVLQGSGQELYPPAEGKNLGIIERHTDNGRTILYLAGSGLAGTAASVEYLIANWQSILEEAKDRDFTYVISCNARTGTEAPADYLTRRWQESDWVTIHKDF